VHPSNPDVVYAAALGTSSDPTRSAASTARATAARRGSACCSSRPTQAASTSRWTPPTHASCTPASGTCGAALGAGERRTGSGLWKSVDGGDTWTELTAKPGLPSGTWGISGISVSRSAPENLYALIENEKGGVFRSRDGGEHWERTNEKRELRQRAWYYTRIFADPSDAESVYVVNVDFLHSKDGGKTFSGIDTPHGDNHDLWIAPDDPARLIEANDGGVNVSRDGGATWTVQSNQPTAQMYRVSTDNDFPYRLLGGQQDNSAVRIRSRSLEEGSIGARDWEPTAGGESGHVVAHPEHPDIVYGGSYWRRSRAHRSREQFGARRRRLARRSDGRGSGRGAPPFPVELPALLLAARTARAVCGGRGAVRVARRGRELEGDLARSDARRRHQARSLGRTDHQGQHRRRVLRDDLRGRGVAAPRRA
jgi:hypothetical protein